jgi:DNA polymerase-1
MSKEKKTLLLVDGTALAYQSFFALQNLKSPEGRPTGAVYGFYQAINQLREEYRPDYLAVALDRGEPEERTKAFAEYKAARPPTPTDLIEQFPLIEEVMTVLGIGVLAIEGVEADDVLGTLAIAARKEGVEVFIFSPDKDMLQIVDDHIKVIRRHGSNTRVYDRAGVEERYGCPPERFIDLLGLMGDKVDNIPGVPGVGDRRLAAE